MPPKKRTRTAGEGQAQAADDQGQPAAANGAAQPQQPPPAAGALDRRLGMADVARRRAAHFANYAADEDEEQDPNNVHVGGNSARHLGMWSSARELVEAREQARQKREEQLRSGGADGEQAAVPAVQWVPSRDVGLGPRPRDATLSLFEIAMQLVVEYIEDVESLWGIPDVVKSRIAAAVCCRRRLSQPVLRLFMEEGPAEVTLPDCTQIDGPAMAEALLACATPRLLKLDLGLCGRSMTDATAASFGGACGTFPAATALRLSGAYRLSDTGLLALLGGMPALQELSLPQCSRLEGPAIEQLPALVAGLRTLDLDECRGLSAATLGAALVGLPHLESVVLNGIPEVGDELLAALACCPSLQRLSLANCSAVGDAGVASIAAVLPGLRQIKLDECTKVTSAGIRALAQHCTSLQDVSLRHLVKVEEGTLCMLVERGTLRTLCLSAMGQVEGPVLSALSLYCKDSLQELDVSWCRRLTNEALGRLVDSCPALRRLNVWGCTQLTGTFLLGHSNEQLEVLGRGEALLPVVKS